VTVKTQNHVPDLDLEDGTMSDAGMTVMTEADVIDAEILLEADQTVGLLDAHLALDHVDTSDQVDVIAEIGILETKGIQEVLQEAEVVLRRHIIGVSIRVLVGFLVYLGSISKRRIGISNGFSKSMAAWIR
jgi:hypothetical protein